MKTTHRLLTLACLLLPALSGRAANQTWIGGSLIDGNWSSGANWSGGVAPGSTSAITSTDIATFNAAIANGWGLLATPIVIDSTTQNINGLTFTGAAGSYVIGTTGGNALRLSSAGTIRIASGLTATNVTQTFNAPLALQGASYTFRNDSASGSGAGSGTLVIGGGVTGTTGDPTLVLRGSNTNANTLSGSIGNDTATSVGVTKTDTGTWVLTGASTYTGRTTVNGGTLTLAFGTVGSDIIASSSALTLIGGTLQLTGTGTQTFAGLTTTAGTGSRILLGSAQTLTLGALTSAGSGSALNFHTAAGGASGATVGSGLVVLTGIGIPGKVINAGFTVTDSTGFGLATVNASNQVIRKTDTTLLPVSGAVVGTPYQIDNNAGGTGAAGSSTLAITASQAAFSITVDTTAAAGAVTLGSGAVLSTSTWNFGGSASSTNPWSISGSAGGAGVRAAATGDTIQINNFAAGTITFTAPILQNGATANPVNLKGTGTTVFAGVNTYTGQTIVRGGTLEVASGGVINHPNNLIVGNSAGDSATLRLLTGGSVSNGGATLGSAAGSLGTANVSGGTWTSSIGLAIGSSGTGVLNLSGGAISSAGGTLGSSAGSLGTANVSGGTWTNSSSLTIGTSGTGVLNLSGTGAISNTLANLGTSAGGLGTANVSGGTWTSSGNLTIGSGGTGVLNLSGGAISNTDARLGLNTGSLGTANVSGGTWTSSVDFIIGASGTGVLNLTGGTVQVGATGTGTVTLGSSSSGSGSGTLNLGTGGTVGTLNAATVNGSDSPGVVNFNHSGSFSFDKALTGSLSVNKLGSGTTTLSGTGNTYSGGTTISAGTLRVTNTSNSGTGTGSVAVTGGALGGTGRITGAVTLSGSGGLDLRDGAVGTLTLTSTLSLTGAAGAHGLSFDLASAGTTTDKIAVTNAVSMTTPGAAVISLNQLGGAANRLTAGTYDLITGSAVPTSGNFSLATTRAFGQSFALTGTATALQLTTTQVTAATPAAFWKGGDNNWSTATNWNTDAASNLPAGAAPDYQTNVTFATTTPAATNIATNVLDTDFDINSLTFSGAAGGVTIGGSKMLTLEATNANGNTAGNGITSNNTSGTNTISAPVALAASQTWTVADPDGTLAVSGVVSDFGGGYALTKAGAGTLILSGANTYTGQTIVSGGTLEVATGGVINHSSANLTVDSATLNLSGGTVSSRQLTIGNSGTGVLNLTGGSISSNGAAFLGLNSSGHGTANVSGGIWTHSGNLEIGRIGTGELNLSGTGAISNTMATLGINNGKLGTANVSGGTWTISGNLEIGLFGTGVLNLTGGTVHAGGTGGTGTVILGQFAGSSGTLNLGTGGTVGTLNAATVTGGPGTAVVNFNHSGSHSFAPALTGSLGVNKLGSGTTTLTGTGNTYTGATRVDSGALVVNGSLNGTSGVTVAASATLAGAGAITTAVNQSFLINGSLSVGNPGVAAVASTFSVTTSGTGSIVMGAGSFILIDVFTGAGTAALGTSDTLSLTGVLNATAGGTLVIGNPNAMTGFVTGDRWQVVNLNTGAGSVTGTLAVDTAALGAGVAGSFDAATGILSIIAAGLPPGPTPEALAAQQTVASTGLPTANAQGQMLLGAGQTVTNDVNNHLFNLIAGDGEEAALNSLAAALDEGVIVGQGDGPEDPIARKGLRSRQWEVFTTVNYGNVKLSAVGSQAGVQVDSWAPGVGIQRHLSRGLALGFAVSFLTSEQGYTGGLGSLHMEGPALSAYLTFVRKNFWNSLLYSFGTYELDSTRNPGAGFATAFGATRTYTNSIQYNAGWNFRFQNNTFVTGPFVGIDYLHGSVDAYSETGGGAAALRYAQQSFESLVTRVGWSASKKLKTSWGAITPQVRLGYERQNLQNNGTSVSLINAPFSATGGNQSPGQDYLVAGAGVNFTLSDRFSLNLNYQGQFFRQGMQAHFGSLRFGYSF